jgi:hypothetical protein
MRSPLLLLGNGSVNPVIVARQQLGKNPSIVARKRLGRNDTAVTNTQAIIEELLDASFSMWPVSYQGKQAISSSQYFLLRIQFKYLLCVCVCVYVYMHVCIYIYVCMRYFMNRYRWNSSDTDRIFINAIQ